MNIRREVIEWGVDIVCYVYMVYYLLLTKNKKEHVKEIMSKTKKLLNLSESKMYHDLKKATKYSEINIFAQQQMNMVINPEELQLTKQEMNTCKHSSFDFVMTDAETKPLFVVEFDGPDHDRYKNMLADLRKMSICTKSGLPILRINYKIYDEFSEDSLVNFIIVRYIKWTEESDELKNEYSEMIEYLEKKGWNHDEIANYMSVEEPEIVFNYKYYFPKIKEMQRELYQNYNVYPDFLDSFPESSFISKYTQIGSSLPEMKNGQTTSVCSYKVTGKIKKNGKIIEYNKTFKTKPVTMRWLYNYYDLVSKDNIKPDISSSESYRNGIPGTQIYDLSFMLAEYKCYNKMLQDVKELKNSGRVFLNERNKDLELFFR